MDLERKALFERELSKRKDRIHSYLTSREYRQRFSPGHICEAAYSYIDAGGKFLRPTVLLLSCGAVGGDEEKAIPAAAAIEVYHTWTLVHDDLLDKDEKRRGDLTVHEKFRRKAIGELGYNETDAEHYGMSIAVLAGDVQQGWSASLLCELYEKQDLDPAIVSHLINRLKMDVQSTLVDGETLDIQYSRLPIESLDQEMIVEMLWKKTGILYEFAGVAGAMIGLNTCESDHRLVGAISSFTRKCGIAFQLQDDILGIVGDEDLLGKPVGSDLREGKRTTVVYYAFENASQRQKKKLSDTLGNRRATEEEISEATDLLRQLGGIQRTKDLAESYVRDGLAHLDDVPRSRYRDLLSMWAEYMIEREL